MHKLCRGPIYVVRSCSRRFGGPRRPAKLLAIFAMYALKRWMNDDFGAIRAITGTSRRNVPKLGRSSIASWRRLGFDDFHDVAHDRRHFAITLGLRRDFGQRLVALRAVIQS